MSGSRTTTLWTKLALLGTAGQAGVVLAVALLGWLLAAPLAYQLSGTAGLAAAAIGGGACLLGAELAIALGALFHGPSAALQAMLFGMLARTLLPLVAGVVLHRQFPWLADAGMIFYLLFFYLTTLAVETVMMLAHVAPRTGAQKST